MEPFAVILADDLIHSRTSCLKQMLGAYDQTGGAVIATMSVPDEHTSRYGIIDPGQTNGDLVEIKGLVEKPAMEDAPSNHAVIGRYVLRPEIFTYLSEQKTGVGGEIQITDAIAQLIGSMPMHGFSFEGTRYDCGNKVGYLHANVALAMAREDMAAELPSLLKPLLD